MQAGTLQGSTRNTAIREGLNTTCRTKRDELQIQTLLLGRNTGIAKLCHVSFKVEMQLTLRRIDTPCRNTDIAS